MFIVGALGSGALMFAYLAAIASGDYVLIFLAGILMSGIVYSAQNGVWPALYGEMFPTRVRLSGVAIGTQIGFAIGGFAPTAAAAIAGDGADGWVPGRGLRAGLGVIAAIAVATAARDLRTCRCTRSTGAASSVRRARSHRGASPRASAWRTGAGVG